MVKFYLMKLKSIFCLTQSLLLLPLLALALAGCTHDKVKPDPMAPPSIVANPGETNVPTLHVGDMVSITFSGLPTQLEPQNKPIKEDGTIMLPDIGSVQAAGKTVGKLEEIIHDLYVPKVYLHLNVTVTASSDRVYYIHGEVKSPGRLIYTGPITVSKAITSAGDFTDFANPSKVWLIRVNGDRFKVNVNRIRAGEDPDPPVYPNDQIEVARRFF